jgi:uncharacterized protein YndB with AHSA1/START domain
MLDILHRVGINASPRDVYNALTTLDGLSSWWTNDTQGRPEIGGVIKFRFGDRGFFDMKVLELEPEKRVMWEVVDGPKEWIGTKVIWDLSPEGAGTTIRFKQQGWREPVDFMHHCSNQMGQLPVQPQGTVRKRQGHPLSERFPDQYRL